MPFGTSTDLWLKEVRVTQVKVLKVQIHIVLKGNSPSNMSRRRKCCPLIRRTVFRAQPQTTVILTSSTDRWRIAVGWYPPTYAHPSPGLTKAKKHPHKHAEAAGKKQLGLHIVWWKEWASDPRKLQRVYTKQTHPHSRQITICPHQITLSLTERFHCFNSPRLRVSR